MSSTNLGSQIVSVKYNDPVDSNIVNARHHYTREPGIYRGGLITASGATSFTLAPLVAELQANNSPAVDAQVRVYMQSAVTVSWVAAANLYIVLRWTYEELAAANYMEITTTTTPTATDVIVAKCTNAAGEVSYSERMSAGVRGHYLRVMPEFPTPLSTSVIIKPGVIWTGTTFSIINEQRLTLTDTTATTYIYVVPSTGVISSTTSLTVVQGNILLARVRQTASTAIDSHMIDDMRSFLSPVVIPDGTTIGYSTTGTLEVPDNGLNDLKLRLRNNQYLRGRNAAGSADINIVKVNTSNVPEFAGAVQVNGRIMNVTDPTAVKDAVNKQYMEAYVLANTRAPRWIVQKGNTYTLTSPTQFTTSVIESTVTIPSFGSFDAGVMGTPTNFLYKALLLTMYVNNTSAAHVTKTLHLYYIDNEFILFVNGTQKTKVTAAGYVDQDVSVSIPPGAATIQIITRDWGVVVGAVWWGDIVDYTNIFPA